MPGPKIEYAKVAGPFGAACLAGGAAGAVTALLMGPPSDPFALWIAFLGALCGVATAAAAFTGGLAAWLFNHDLPEGSTARRSCVVVVATVSGALSAYLTLTEFRMTNPAGLVLFAAAGTCIAATFALRHQEARMGRSCWSS